MLRRSVLVGLFLVASIGPAAVRGDGLTLRFENTGKGVRELPIFIEVTPPKQAGPPSGPGLAGIYTLTKVGRDKSSGFTAILRKQGDQLWLETVLLDVDAGANAYKVTVAPVIPPSALKNSFPVEFRSDGRNLAMVMRGEPVATYLVDSGPKPIIWPLIGPEKLRFTRAFPMEKVAGEDLDHPHQRSLWFTYGMVNGVDFWSEQGKHGSIKETSRNARGNSVRGLLNTTDDWLGPDGKKVLEDARQLTVWSTGTSRILDLVVTLKATEGPVEFGDTKEGMFGLRVPSSMDVKAKKGGKIVNAQGLTDGAAWGKRSSWVDYSGPVDGKTVGITILEHPTSYGSPTPWHVRDYGLFAANPFGKHDFGLADKPTSTTLPKGESFTFRYRVILHEGDAHAADPSTAYEFFAKPPKMTLTRD